MITAGPTYEKIDPVRFIGNFSSGKMGYALAEECAERGAKVILISGPVSLTTIHPNIQCIKVQSAEEMFTAATLHFKNSDVSILCAAVADYTPSKTSSLKIKRTSDKLSIDLVSTKDIAATLGKTKKKHQILVGFALETNDALSNAESKLNRKNLDFIVLNSLEHEGAGFQKDTNKISILNKEGQINHYDLKPKRAVASDIIDYLQAKY